MKEKDIRERIQTFLKNTVRHVVVPASMGIGLALIGCGSSDSSQKPDDTKTSLSTSTSTDTSGAVALYMAQMPTATGQSTSTGTSGPVPAYMAPQPTVTSQSTGTGTEPRMKYMAIMPDAGVADGPVGTITATAATTSVLLYAAPMTATKTALATNVMDYAAPMPGTGTKTSVTTGMVALYAAPMTGSGISTDTKVDAGAVLKYSAVMPDAGMVVAVYSAPMADAGTTPVLRYMAVQPPDAGRADTTPLGTPPGFVALYMAALPDVSKK
jgi:hypothetical protein